MTHIFPSRRGATALLAGLLGVTLAGCKMDVINPGVIDAAAVDPASDATSLSLSGQTGMWHGIAAAAIFGAYFSGELRFGGPRQFTVDFARRAGTSSNQDLVLIWSPISSAVGMNERVLDLVGSGPTAGSDVNVARAAMSSAFGLIAMAEYFCQGVYLGGPPMTPQQTLDSALVRFQRAITVGNAAAAVGVAEGASIAHAAEVGLARAYLQQGNNANALAAANDALAHIADPTWSYTAVFVDDASNRGRVSNPFYVTTQQDLLVPPAYQNLSDSRVPFVNNGTIAVDTLTFVQQLKFTSFTSPFTIASYLEALYIQAEAALKANNDPSLANALIAVRHAAGGPAAAPDTESTVLGKLLDEKARDFWLEGRHIADFSRNPTETPFVGQPGEPFYRSGQGNYGTATCIAVPQEELSANPNFD